MAIWLIVFKALLECVMKIAVTSGMGIFMGPVIVCVVFCLFHLHRSHIRAYRRLNKLSSNAADPLYVAFTETSVGVQHIRAFQWVDDFTVHTLAQLDQAQKPFFYLQYLRIWVWNISSLIVAVTVVIGTGLALTFPSATSPGLVGVALITFPGLTLSLRFYFHSLITLENETTAVKNLKAIFTETPSETEPKLRPGRLLTLARHWPREGRIDVHNMFAKYE